MPRDSRSTAARTSSAREVSLYLAGARLVGDYRLPLLPEVNGLTHVIGTYDGALTMGVSRTQDA